MTDMGEPTEISPSPPYPPSPAAPYPTPGAPAANYPPPPPGYGAPPPANYYGTPPAAYGQPNHYGAPPNYAPARACPNCHRDWGLGLTCQFCRQVSGLPNGVALSTPGKRLGGYLLDFLLVIVTLWIGWVVWSLFAWGRGQTPAKQLLGMRVLKLATSSTATWGTMFLREVIGKFVGWIVNSFTLGILVFMLLWDKNNQEIWDKIAATIVVDDPNGLLAPRSR